MSGLRIAKYVLAAGVALGFVVAGHYAAAGLIAFQQRQQLTATSSVALRRAEAAVDLVSTVLGSMTAQGAVSCDPDILQSIRLNVYQSGAVKDIRVTDGKGLVLCAARPETLEFDQQWVVRDDMLETRDASMRLFRVDQFFGTALGVLKERTGGGAPGEPTGLAAILALTGASFDILPAELQNRSTVTLELADGSAVAQTASGLDEKSADIFTVSSESKRLPLRATVRVDRAALAEWDQSLHWPITALFAALGFVSGLLVLRLANRPADPVREIDKAIAAGEFKPYLQPIFNLASGHITGAEILARRVMRDGTVQPPSRFIDLAEQSGRIAPITWMLLSQALRDLQPLFLRDPDFTVSVNITPRHFMEAAFVHELEWRVAQAGVPASRITLELTEREPFDDFWKASRVVQVLRGLGFRVALDDVGTGHSGLSQIQSLHADVLKIDKFFVDAIGRDPSATLMVEMLVRLAAQMKMGVVAEGIEEGSQAEALHACGVASGQGYLVSPPLPAAAFLQLFDERAMRAALAGDDEKAARAA